MQPNRRQIWSMTYPILISLMNLHGLTEMTRADFERYRKLYSPYGSVASIYLWAADKLPM